MWVLIVKVVTFSTLAFITTDCLSLKSVFRPLSALLDVDTPSRFHQGASKLSPFSFVNLRRSRETGLYGQQSNLETGQSRNKPPELSPETVAIFNSLNNFQNTGGAGGSSSIAGLINLDKAWHKLKNGGWQSSPAQVVSVEDDANDITSLAAYDYIDSGNSQGESVQYDIIVCGGTLGIFYAAVMQNMGYKVCVIERGKLLGRSQEWNISRNELNALVRLKILNPDDLNKIIGIEFNPVRVGFKTDTSPESSTPGFETYVDDVLNLGVRPDILIELTKQKFMDSGGTVLEGAAISNIHVTKHAAEVMYTVSSESRSSSSTSSNEGTRDSSTAVNMRESQAQLSPSPSSSSLSARVVLDAMGNGSPISRQIRGSVEPDGICIVVGSCARGFNPSNNTYSDVIYTDTPITQKIRTAPTKQSQLQYFWEAFPSGSGKSDRTTYLFTYMDAKPERPSISEIIDDYWELLPRYQGVGVEDLQFIRVLYGMFPTYRASPLQSTFPRILQVGDASGIQSPLSFGGFGSLTRHLQRITSSLQEALDGDLLTAADLACINAYQPNLSACWMFQRAMSVPVGGRQPAPDEVVRTLTNSFSAMEKLGNATMLPFLQDVLQFGPLLRTLLVAGIQDPLTPFRIIPHVGVGPFLDFVRHFFMTGVYTVLYRVNGARALRRAASLENDLTPRQRFQLRRRVDAWKFGSGLDYDDHK